MRATGGALPALARGDVYGAGGDRGPLDSSEAAQVGVDLLIGTYGCRHRGRRADLVAGLMHAAMDIVSKLPAFSCHCFGTLHTPHR